MKYTNQQKADIGKAVLDEGLTGDEAAARYGVSRSTVDVCKRLYRESLMAMTKEELIDEVILARAEAERAKKGYSAKGGGASKEFVPLKGSNTK